MLCELCQSEEAHNFHHFIPRTLHTNKWFKRRYTRLEMQQGIEVCKSCHSAIHNLIPDEKELGRCYNTRKTLLSHPEVGRFVPNDDNAQRMIKTVFEETNRKLMRRLILNRKQRIDGRALAEIRPISCEVGILPRTHGSALFTRGETEVLAVVTFGTSEDEQKINSLSGETNKSFMLHYNFPPFSVGEVSPLRSPSRREIGHGALAERAIQSVLPSNEKFPYTIRIVSEVLESNGSSSMATVCGASLSLMDAGVPIKAPVAGIAMGLIHEDGEVAVLSDILDGQKERGNEFHGLTIAYAYQDIPFGRTKPLGTADALLQDLLSRTDWRGKKLLVCNSDNLYSVQALGLLAACPEAAALIDYDRDGLSLRPRGSRSSASQRRTPMGTLRKSW